jgi:murein DD-endopeptidase MepM/ murein hydrolase activator NlpD
MNKAVIRGDFLPIGGARLRLRRLFAMVGILSLLVAGTVVGQTGDAAFAANYPSWGDVQAARNSVAAKEAEIKRLDSLLSSLESAVTSAQALAIQKGDEYQAAQQKADEAAYKANELKNQADAAKVKADSSKQQAGQLAAQLARSGGGDLTATLFFSGDDADNLLSQLGLASVVKDRSASLYEKAARDENSLRSMNAQATVAQDALKAFATAAQTALDEANAASDRANAALTEQETNKTRLDAQRASLASNSATTEASYNTGVAVAAAAAAAAAKAAAEWAAAHPAPSEPAGSGNGSGWVRPAGGPISSGYGYRINPVTGVWALHAGTDLAAGCNSPIYAASSGTVSFASWNGGYGNFILINHGGGLSTGYGHIVNGGTLVSVGQSVSAGQQIARVGSTGNSTGCHLHFETRPGGTAVDAVPFMAARGVRLG